MKLHTHLAPALLLLAISCSDPLQLNSAVAYSTASSLGSAAVNTDVLRTGQVVRLTGAWHVLTESEYDRYVSLVSELIDTGRQRRSRAAPLCDPWGRRFLVAVRTNEHGSVKVIVWSKGPDGISGDADDIVSPPGQKQPLSR